MKPLYLVLALSVLTVGFISSGSAQTANSSSITKAVAESPFFPLEDLKPGMKGVARTVFAGTEPQEFGGGILGVLPVFPRLVISDHRAINGANAKKPCVAGMSGLPLT